MKHLSLIFIILTTLPNLTQAAPAHVKATLLSNAKTIKPGDSFEIGVLLNIDPHWHIYWENPGEIGTPTTVKFTAPKGITIDELKYPLPATFTQPGDIKGYGYEDQTMLIAKITVPKDWPKDKPIDLTAEVSWLTCKETCIPGQTNLDLSIKIADESQPDNHELFTKWKSQLPLDANEAAEIVKIAGPANDLTLTWTKPVKEITVLTIPPDGIEVTSIAIDNSEKITHIKPTIKGTPKPDTTLGLLITYEDQTGHPQGIRVSAPLKK